MRFLRLAFLGLLGSCGGSVATTGADAGSAALRRDATTAQDAAPGPEGGTIVGTCSLDGGCPDGSTCVFAIGSCAAPGQCFQNQAEGCGSRTYLCGCNGATVTTGCGTFGGATGPTTGAGSQFDVHGSTTDDFCPEGGLAALDAGVDATSREDAADATDASCAALGAVSQAPCSLEGQTCGATACDSCECQEGVWLCTVCPPPPH